MVAWAINEFVLGANPAVFMYLAGSQFAGILYDIGNEQQRHWAAMAIDRNWGATMGPCGRRMWSRGTTR